MKHRSRLERAEQLEVAGASLAAGQPLRRVAGRLGVARSTLRGWRAAVPLDGMPPEVAAGLSTPAGARWLHRLVADPYHNPNLAPGRDDWVELPFRSGA